MEVSLQNVIDLYDNCILKEVKNKKKIRNFELFKISNLSKVYEDLLNPHYHITHYNIFIIYEPKKRVIMSLNLHDKIVNHYFTTYCLIPKLSFLLDNRNVATREGMGSDYGIKLLIKYIEHHKKYANFYALKIDISKYFPSIDHDVLKSLLKPYLNDFDYQFTCNIIDSTNESYINSIISSLATDLPLYKYGKGLPIGNLSSQFLAIYYLSFLDHYIVHDLHLKYYVRYMDDFIILHHDKEYLRSCLKEIINKLENVYKLKINVKKTKIVNVKEGFVFLSYNFKILNKKTIIKLRYETKKKMHQKVKELFYLFSHNLITLEYFYSSLNNYMYTFKYTDRLKVISYINSFL